MITVEPVEEYHVEYVANTLDGDFVHHVFRNNYCIAKFKTADEAKDHMNYCLEKDSAKKLAKRAYQVYRASPTMKVIGLNYTVKLFNEHVAAFAAEDEAIKFCALRNSVISTSDIVESKP